MPPRGGKLPRPRDSAATHQSPSFVSEPDQANGHEDNTPPAPFFNTTFSAHRVSPLHVGQIGLPPARLRALARRLRDALTGDVVRGVEVGLGDGEAGGVEGAGFVARAGALLDVTVGWVRVGSLLRCSEGEGRANEDGDGGTRRAADWRRRRALHVRLRYENAACTALLLPPLGTFNGSDGRDGYVPAFSVSEAHRAGEDKQAKDSFLSLPLLLLRMPVPLQAVVVEFLSTAFDCRISALRLGTRSIMRIWEAWIQLAGSSSARKSSASLLVAKDVVLTLGFYVPPTTSLEPSSSSGQGEEADKEKPVELGLKSIDVIIPGEEVGRFAKAGRALLSGRRHAGTGKRKGGWETDIRKRRKLAGRLHEEGWEWRTGEEQDESSSNAGRDRRKEAETEQPFAEALARYVDEHLALDLFHPGVRITKIACGGFVMSEKRLKVFAPPGGEEEEDVLGSGDNGSIRGQRGAAYALLRDLVDKAGLERNA